jgi:hypothetical protein
MEVKSGMERRLLLISRPKTYTLTHKRHLGRKSGSSLISSTYTHTHEHGESSKSHTGTGVARVNKACVEHWRPRVFKQTGYWTKPITDSTTPEEMDKRREHQSDGMFLRKPAKQKRIQKAYV